MLTGFGELRYSGRARWRLFLLLPVSALFIAASGAGQRRPPALKLKLPHLSFPQQIPDYSHAEPVVEMSLRALARRYPFLKHLQPANPGISTSQILTNLGNNMSLFARHFRNVTAIERIHMSFVSPVTGATYRSRLTCRYIVITKRTGNTKFYSEYRTDLEGRRLRLRNLRGLHMITEGFATASLMFSLADLPFSEFRLLGGQTLLGKPRYALAYAERPGAASAQVVNWAFDGYTVPLLTQGIIWVDATRFEPRLLISDLLAPQPELGLTRLFSEIWYKRTELPTVEKPLWLPHKVKVIVNVDGGIYTNVHQYSKYQIFRSQARMVTNLGTRPESYEKAGRQH
jgi:hypothetical protein